MKKTFHHTGVITNQLRPGEIYVAASRVWVTSPDNHPHRIEFLRFESDSPVQGAVRNRCHTAYVVENLEAVIADKSTGNSKAQLVSRKPKPVLQRGGGPACDGRRKTRCGGGRVGPGGGGTHPGLPDESAL